MIKAHFDSIVSQLRSHSASLTKENIFVDKPWTIIDEDNEIQRLFFKRDRSLIMSKNGEVNYGSWDYLPEMRSIVINRINNSILCNEAYIDEGILILKLDGTNNQFFILANENVIPDLNIGNYLDNIRNEKLFLSHLRLVDGEILDIQRSSSGTKIAEGNKVSINDKNVQDGFYPINDGKRTYEIKDNQIIQILTIKNYYTSDKKKLLFIKKNIGIFMKVIVFL